MFLGYVSQLLFPPKVATEKHRHGYAALYNKFESFYSNYVYRRIKDCFNRPISSVPGDTIVLKDRVTHNFGWNFNFTGTETKCLNLGSYNYLGFAQNEGPCAEDSIKSLQKYGVSFGSPRREFGTHPLHLELERLTAQFLGAEDAIIFGMGFATNSLNLPALFSPGCLVVSDERNHASIILGLRLSNATVRLYRHNDMKSLEKVLQKGIIEGQPKTGEPWKKVVIMMEGVFSMEGSIVHLPEIVALKKKYNAYIYLDEAHSIGAVGPHGRGVVDHFGVDPKDIDVLMGTFTKSFGSAGGYIAGSKKLINFLRANSHASCYANSMAAPVAQQILTSMKMIMGLDGTSHGKERIEQLIHNTRYFRKRLAQMGVNVYGNNDSPVVPMMVYKYSNLL
jgi:serine palmitoyltransferase